MENSRDGSLLPLVMLMRALLMTSLHPEGHELDPATCAGAAHFYEELLDACPEDACENTAAQRSIMNLLENTDGVHRPP